MCSSLGIFLISIIACLAFGMWNNSNPYNRIINNKRKQKHNPVQNDIVRSQLPPELLELLAYRNKSSKYYSALDRRGASTKEYVKYFNYEIISVGNQCALLGRVYKGPETRAFSRVLAVWWTNKLGQTELDFMEVPLRYEQYLSVDEYPPEDINSAEDVRRWTLRMKPGERLILET